MSFKRLSSSDESLIENIDNPKRHKGLLDTPSRIYNIPSDLILKEEHTKITKHYKLWMSEFKLFIRTRHRSPSSSKVSPHPLIHLLSTSFPSCTHIWTHYLLDFLLPPKRIELLPWVCEKKDTGPWTRWFHVRFVSFRDFDKYYWLPIHPYTVKRCIYVFLY
jgi:hypothetical protein